MLLAIVQNGSVSAVGDYRSLFPQTSFSDSGPHPSFLAENGCLPASASKAHDQSTHKLVSVAPYVESGTVYTVRAEPLSADDLAQRKAAKAAEVRAQRDKLLTEADWTQLQDYPKSNQNAWRIYRQALRDVPQQAGFPETVTWPTKPSESA